MLSLKCSTLDFCCNLSTEALNSLEKRCPFMLRGLEVLVLLNQILYLLSPNNFLFMAPFQDLFHFTTNSFTKKQRGSVTFFQNVKIYQYQKGQNGLLSQF